MNIPLENEWKIVCEDGDDFVDGLIELRKIGDVSHGLMLSTD